MWAVAFKPQLKSELTKITLQLESIASKNPQTYDWVVIPVSQDVDSTDTNLRADAVEEWSTRKAMMAQLETRYCNIITRDLDKMNQGTFEQCEISGKPIELERLTANPAARTNLANIDREKELPL